jgi:STE24 endopeptidase
MLLEYKNKDALKSEVNVQIQMVDEKIQVPDTPPKVQANYEFSQFYFFTALGISLITPILFYKFGGIELIRKRAFKHKVVEGIVLIILYSIFSEILIISKVFFSSFYRGRLVGLRHEALLEFIQNYFTEGTIGFLLTVPVILIIYILFLKKKRWYLISAIIMIVISLVATYVYPYIDEIENDLVVMEDGDLKSKIQDIAKKADIQDLDIRVIEKSQETTSMNAYMTGIGNSRRIVFWDTTLNGLNEEEILSVAGHEMGHYKENHIQKSIALAIVGILLSFIILDQIMKRYKGKDYRKIDYLPHILFIVNVMAILATPIETAYSRKNEIEADKFAIDLTNDSYTNGALEIRFINSNLSPIDVKGLYKWLAYDHPTTRERIELSNESYE